MNVVSVAKPEQFSLAKVFGRPESDQLLPNGVVAADVSRTMPVNALSSGRVVDIRGALGDDVQARAAPAHHDQPGYVAGVLRLSKFQADEALAKTQLERAELLYSKGASRRKKWRLPQDTYNKANIDTKTAAEHIRILGGDPEHPSPLIEIHAPVSGTIIEQNVTSAAGIKSLDNSPNLFTIADLSNVWVLCDVFENDLAQVHVGDRAEIELNAYPNRRLAGTCHQYLQAARSEYARRQSSHRAAQRRRHSAAQHVRHGAFRLAGNVRCAPWFPSGAVLRLQDRDWVFVKLNDGKFRRTEVQAGPVDSDGTQADSERREIRATKW